MSDKIKIIYGIINQNPRYYLKLFGDIFVKNNKHKCKMIINGKEENLSSFYYNNIKRKNKIFEIKLIGIKNIIDISHMFDGCNKLLSLPDISKINTIKVIFLMLI